MNVTNQGQMWVFQCGIPLNAKMTLNVECAHPCAQVFSFTLLVSFPSVITSSAVLRLYAQVQRLPIICSCKCLVKIYFPNSNKSISALYLDLVYLGFTSNFTMN